ncbi:metallophosphoesterase family protein [Profundibacterium mesophilum]|nr:metallophosphoesterase [Profundibacterium mesophilum]
MSEFRFIHVSDLHLGRRYANIPQPEDGNIRGRLMEARHGTIERIAAAARDHGAEHVLVAGDSFDTPTPSDVVLRQALSAMGRDPDIMWWLLPGNHDNLRDGEPLWEQIARQAPQNVRPLTRAEPVSLRPDVTLLPCPVTYRSAGRDLTECLPRMPSAEGALRIGLAHGGVVDFVEAGDNIPPDRDRSARLDYLALGDWHGRMAVGPRVQYSGTPEQDRFKHDRRGVALAVTLEGVGMPPRIEEMPIGQFHWSSIELPLYHGQDAAQALAALLPAEGRRDALVRVNATGWSSLPEHDALTTAAARIAPDFAHFELRAEDLQIAHDDADLDEIDQAGALRKAAETLQEESRSQTLSQEDRDISSAALARLYSYVKEDAR